MCGLACGHCRPSSETGKNEKCTLDTCKDSGAYNPQAVLAAAEKAEKLGVYFPQSLVHRANQVIADQATAAADAERLSHELSSVPPICP